MKHYRTYVTTFTRNGGEFIYAGKRISEYEDPSDDPYFGSGREVVRAVEKYGRKCIVSIEWFEHTKETYQLEEILLIENMKRIHGNRCVNRARGGNGGYTMEYATAEQKNEHRRKLSESSYKRWESNGARLKQSISQKIVQNRPEVKKKISDHHKKYFSDPIVRMNRSMQTKLSNSRPEVRKKLSDSNKSAKRRGLVWDMYKSGEMSTYWIESGKLKYVMFSKWLSSVKNIDILPSKLMKCVKQMEEDLK